MIGKRIIEALMAGTLTLTGCTSSEPPLPTQPLATPDSAAIAAFERMFSPRDRDNGYVNCLAVDGADPSATVLLALQTSGYTAVPASECTYAIEAPGGFHTASGKRAIFHSVGNFAVYGSTAAELEGASVVHGLDATSSLFDLVYKDGRWQLTFVKPTGVS